MSDPSDPDLQRRLEVAAGNLPRMQREIFMAHRLDNMSYEEIAATTGLSVRRVERHLAKAVYKITKQVRRGRRLSWWERRF